MKKFIVLIFLTLFGFQISAQSLKSGFESLKNGNPSNAAKIFSKAMDKGNETIAAGYGLGLTYCDSSYSNFNNLKGFRFIRNAFDRFDRMSTKNKEICKNIYGFDKSEIYKNLCLVAERDLEMCIKSNSIENLKNFVDLYEGADPQILKAKELISAKSWEKFDNQTDFRSYKTFAEEYPNSKFADSAKYYYKTKWQSICEDFYSEGEITQMRIFETQYPDYPFYTEKNKADKTLAEYAEKLKLQNKFVSDYEPYYKEYIEKAAPCQLAYVTLQRLISPYLEWGRFDEAAEILSRYKSKFPLLEKDFNKIIAILKSPSKKYTSKPFPSTINTDAMEYAPVITPDGNTLYFCGFNRSDNVGMEDIFYSKKENGQWLQAEIFPQFNTPIGNEAPLAVSPDGNMLLIYKNSNIYFTEKTLRGWKPLQKMTAINTDQSWEADASFSADGNAIFFISDRKGNIGRYHPHQKSFHGAFHGNTDIYVCTKNPDGTWNEPINLGKTINTPYAERSPILASDMKTLYFSSDGHYGLGKLDVFKCERLSDTSWTMWSEPINLGKELNTAGDDYNYVVSTDGKQAYFSKITSTSSNICSIDLPENMRPKVIASVTGKVTNEKGEKLPAKIKWEDLETGKLLGNLECDPSTGKYFITLPSGKNYGYYVEYQGYYPVSGNLNTEKLKEGKNIEHNIIMYSIEDILSGKISIRLSNIFFETDKYDLKSESFPELKRLCEFIKQNEGIKLEISGHTDNSGSEAHNQTLSEKRAESVKKYLESLGCNPDFIYSKGYGSQKPVSDNSTEKGKAQNRRVEFRITAD